MKKKTIAIGALLLALNSFGQTDTLLYNVTDKHEDFTFKIKDDEYVYIDLSDNRDRLYVLYRNITAHYRDGSVKKLYIKSRRRTLEIDGSCVKEVIVHKPKLK